MDLVQWENKIQSQLRLSFQAILNMYPLWQVSYDTQLSNGSNAPRDPTWKPSWLKDMAVNIQMQCELHLQGSHTTFWMEYEHVDYIMDLVHMTQLNSRSGTLRKVGRLLLFQISYMLLRTLEKHKKSERSFMFNSVQTFPDSKRLHLHSASSFNHPSSKAFRKASSECVKEVCARTTHIKAILAWCVCVWTFR